MMNRTSEGSGKPNIVHRATNTSSKRQKLAGSKLVASSLTSSPKTVSSKLADICSQLASSSDKSKAPKASGRPLSRADNGDRKSRNSIHVFSSQPNSASKPVKKVGSGMIKSLFSVQRTSVTATPATSQGPSPEKGISYDASRTVPIQRTYTTSRARDDSARIDAYPAFSPFRNDSPQANCSQVKVVARIRPLSKAENTLIEGGVGNICCQVTSENSLFVTEENQSFAFDHVFSPDAKQEDIYNMLGQGTVEDVLHGYNGTIFAYGQSGSGKTHTMFGPNIFDPEMKGMIPRAASDIFRVWDVSPDVKEVEVKCSMLEIYMEKLRDLLTDEAVDLKVKQSPSRGIYVEGLTEVDIESEEEMMYYVDMGEQRRVWAETRHNAVSSRSHTIFMIEVRQIFANETEWRGLLNLVDLAGSEKVGKTGAQGQTFEEGTKINLSLSALGNVIHSLSLGLDHVPYRESKITRLLQESLGGNYKTSLIVTCSPHSSQLQETISTLKFAQRAKKLKNNVRVNVQNSPDRLMKMIEQLKKALMEKEATISRLTGGTMFDNEEPGSMSINGKSPLSNDREVHESLDEEDEEGPKVILIEKQDKEKEQEEDKDTQKQVALMPKRGETNRKLDQVFPEIETAEAIASPMVKRRVNAALTNLYTKFRENEVLHEKSAAKVKELTTQVEWLKKERSKLLGKLKASELDLASERKHLVVAEEEIKQLKIELQKKDLVNRQTTDNVEQESVMSEVYERQLKALAEALEDADAECAKLLKERKERLQKDTVEMCNLSLSDYAKLSRAQAVFTDKWVQDLKTVGLSFNESIVAPVKEITKSVDMKLDEKLLLSSSKYAEALDSAVIEQKVAPETYIYLLKNQLVDASIFNHNLRRVISSLIWKLHMERGEAKVKTEICRVLQQSVEALEDIMKKSTSMHQSWKERFEKLDYDISMLKQQLATRKFESSRNLSSFIACKPNIRRRLHRQTFVRPEQKQMIAAALQVTTPPSAFQRTRAMVPVTEATQVSEEDGQPKVCVVKDNDEMTGTPKGKDNAKEEGTVATRRSKEDLINLGVLSRKPAKQDFIIQSEQDLLKRTCQEAQVELAWNKTLTELLMAELAKTRGQAERLRQQIDEIKLSSEQLVQDENKNWQQITDSLKARVDPHNMCRITMTRNSRGSSRPFLSSTHSSLAGWSNTWSWKNSRASTHGVLRSQG